MSLEQRASYKGVDVSILFASRESCRTRREGKPYLFEPTIAQLALKVINGMENCRILLQEITKRLRKGLGLALRNLAQATGLVLGKMPVDLADFAGRQLGDAACAGAVVSRGATVHVGEDKVLRLGCGIAGLW